MNTFQPKSYWQTFKEMLLGDSLEYVELFFLLVVGFCLGGIVALIGATV